MGRRKSTALNISNTLEAIKERQVPQQRRRLHYITLELLPCDCEAYARSCYRQLSVCLSIKRVHCDKTR